jgi:hypothetical protein
MDGELLAELIRGLPFVRFMAQKFIYRVVCGILTTATTAALLQTERDLGDTVCNDANDTEDSG